MADLVKLKTFLYAAENMSFSEAAKHLHLTEPTISHHIKTLEREMEVELLIRSGGTLKLTEAGRLLMPWGEVLSIRFQEFRPVFLEARIIKLQTGFIDSFKVQGFPVFEKRSFFELHVVGGEAAGEDDGG